MNKPQSPSHTIKTEPVHNVQACTRGGININEPTSDIYTICKQQIELDNMVQELIHRLITSVRYELEQTTPTMKDHPNIAVVSMKTVAKSPNLNLSPEYYIPKEQADAICKKLSKNRNINDVCAALREIIETKSVRTTNQTITLNPETIKILEESEIGLFVMGKQPEPMSTEETIKELTVLLDNNRNAQELFQECYLTEKQMTALEQAILLLTKYTKGDTK